MKLKRFISFAAAGALTVAIGATAALAQPPITAVSSVSSVQIQNTNSTPTNLTVTYYTQSGSIDTTTSESIAAGSNINIYQPNVSGLSSGFRGNAVLASDQPIGAIGAIVKNWSNGKSGAANYSGLNQVDLGDVFYLPAINKNFGGGQFSTQITIQNSKSSSVSGTITYYNGSNGSLAGSQNFTVPANGSTTVDQSTSSAISNGFNGGAVVAANNASDEIAVIAEVFNAEGRLSAYNGFASGSLNAFAPTISKKFGGGQFTTSFQIMALDSGSTNVTASYRNNNGTEVKSKSFTLNQFQSVNEFQGSDTSLSDGFIGSLVVSANKNVVVVVNSISQAGGLATVSYNGFPAGATKFFLPSLTKSFGGGNYTSGFQVMNVGSGSAQVTVKFYQAGSSTPFKTDTYSGANAIGQYKSVNTFMGSVSEASNGFVGSVIVESNQPVVVIGNSSGANVNGDGATSYNGVK